MCTSILCLGQILREGGGHGSREIRLVEERYNEAEGKTQRIETGGLKNKGIKFFFLQQTDGTTAWMKTIRCRKRTAMVGKTSLCYVKRTISLENISAGFIRPDIVIRHNGGDWHRLLLWINPSAFQRILHRMQCVCAPKLEKNNVFVHLQRATYSKSRKKKTKLS